LIDVTDGRLSQLLVIPPGDAGKMHCKYEGQGWLYEFED
jgi:hypothetical protein